MLSPSPLLVLAPSDKSAVAVEDIVATIESTTQRSQKVMDRVEGGQGDGSGCNSSWLHFEMAHWGLQQVCPCQRLLTQAQCHRGL